MGETYKKEILCWNCDFFNTFQIPKGVRIDGWGEGAKCQNCGCDPRTPIERAKEDLK